jgi:hypothetical protein
MSARMARARRPPYPIACHDGRAADIFIAARAVSMVEDAPNVSSLTGRTFFVTRFTQWRLTHVHAFHNVRA